MTDNLQSLGDAELQERARKVRETLQRLPADHVSSESYLLVQDLIAAEMKTRGLPWPPGGGEPGARRQPGASGLAPGGFYPR